MRACKCASSQHCRDLFIEAQDWNAEHSGGLYVDQTPLFLSLPIHRIYWRDQNYSGSGKCFQESISEKSLILLRGNSCRESKLFPVSVFALHAGQITAISLKATYSSKKVLKITGPALSRMNLVIISALPVVNNCAVLLESPR